MSDIIKDLEGREIYWPISGLVEGQTSEVLHCLITCPVSNGRLVSTADTRAKVWGRRESIGGTYYDLAVDPIDLSALSGEIEFEVYVEALSPISGFERVPITVGAARSTAAGWMD